MSDEEKAHFDGVTVVHETAAALLCLIDGVKHWIPKKCIDEDSDVYKMGTDGTLIVSMWLAVEKGLV